MNLPSVKKLQTIPYIDRAKALEIREWLKYIFDKSTPKPPIPPAIERWIQASWRGPNRMELAHAVIAYIVTNCHTNAWEIFQDQEEWDSCIEGPAWEAVNVGDPYIPTLICHNGRYFVGCWGDLPEVNK